MTDPLPKTISGEFVVEESETEATSILKLITSDSKFHWVNWIIPVTLMLIVIGFLGSLFDLLTSNNPLFFFVEDISELFFYASPMVLIAYVIHVLRTSKIKPQKKEHVFFEWRPQEYYEVRESHDSKIISCVSYDEIDKVKDLENGLRFSSSKHKLSFELSKSSLSTEEYQITRDYLHNRVKERNEK